MSKIAIIIAPSNFRDEEYFEPKEVLIAAGHTVTTASTIIGEVKGSHGKSTITDIFISDINSSKFDAVILVGGSGSYQYDNNSKVHEVINDFYKHNKLVAAICHAPIILARAGILRNKQATVFSGDKDELISLGITFIDSPVVIAGNIITANGPLAATDFGHAINKYLT